MNSLLNALEALPSDEPWHVSLGSDEFLLSNFEAVDTSIYGRGDVILADVVKKVCGSSPITSRNKIEFEISQVLFVKSVDGASILFSREKGLSGAAT